MSLDSDFILFRPKYCLSFNIISFQFSYFLSFDFSFRLSFVLRFITFVMFSFDYLRLNYPYEKDGKHLIFLLRLFAVVQDTFALSSAYLLDPSMTLSFALTY